MRGAATDRIEPRPRAGLENLSHMTDARERHTPRHRVGRHVNPQAVQPTRHQTQENPPGSGLWPPNREDSRQENANP